MALNINKQNKTTSIKLVCEVCNISKSTYYHKPKLSDENTIIADWLPRLVTAHKRWGFKLCYLYLRNIKDFKWNYKVFTEYTENWN
ncbi:hypothetical protein THERMOT_1872 [Bathymodiolus thermophilus thioautotrophic gill symbiont]|uniref:Transposase n=1 Tax=Bathymodiolus thermophilus thioautotrophic gill symbiont TaxID=2360 RepID=A0A1J5UL82_9GAMM|nr:hypothetical protein [Bathymodiolus thermophilus thioautotrophic gill symbiont]OIR25015.1 hypothetical protein BGC33_05240 [Bathymodiolus thermophilus thioautotrophic gill symbiont]CAB5503901.1 hypothetical protein THERMOT_1872 [Bathymodiolus thermophilus thioautotrophic gill symbiont]CAB5505973.1 hypothetical protein THERMOS_2219 [Bathymodiolus thermophilus thioautotrophic gill symbiont]